MSDENAEVLEVLSCWNRFGLLSSSEGNSNVNFKQIRQSDTQVSFSFENLNNS